MFSVFYHPISPGSNGLLWLLFPLCVSVAVVYKTIRTDRLRRLPLEILAAVGYMVVGMVLLGTSLWLVQKLFQ